MQRAAILSGLQTRCSTHSRSSSIPPTVLTSYISWLKKIKKNKWNLQLFLHSWAKVSPSWRRFLLRTSLHSSPTALPPNLYLSDICHQNKCFCINGTQAKEEGKIENHTSFEKYQVWKLQFEYKAPTCTTKGKRKISMKSCFQNSSNAVFLLKHLAVRHQRDESCY